MQNQGSDNKRIAKNTMFLYFRMLLVMGVSLFTSRVILATLGEVDYGLYNVIGGVVTTFTFITSAMGNASARYITFALGKGKEENAEKVFSTALLVHVALALLILVLAETVGLWFVNTHMSIPSDRMVAANWVYQFSIITTLFSIISIPFNSEIIAHEKMSAFAYISIFDVSMKLAVVYMLYESPFDKLIFYAGLLMAVQVFNISLYIYYCKKHFPEVKLKWYKDLSLVKDMSSFAGWSLIGNLSFVCYTQGLNILLNIFFGPAINAARGIAVQVQTAVMNFILNFQTAVSPQITKSYAVSDVDRLQKLVQSSSKLSFFILYCMLLPVALEAEYILRLWLNTVPNHTVAFLRLILLVSIIDCLSRPITIAMNATGNIKRYQIVSCGIMLFILPLSYILLLIGLPSEIVFLVHLILALTGLIAELIILYRFLNIRVSGYLSSVIAPILRVVFVSSLLPVMVFYFLPNNLSSTIIVVVMSIISVAFSIYLFGITKTEKRMVIEKIKQIKK